MTKPTGFLAGKKLLITGAADIADAVSAAGIDLQKNEVRLTTGSIRQIGEYDVDLHLHNEVKTQIRVNVIAEA